MRRLTNSNQTGAVLAITAVAMVIFMGAAALAIDLGVGWSARRNLVTTTDASALAAGGTYAIGGTGCDAVASAYLAANNPDATLTGCTAAGTSVAGTVIVDAEEVIDTFFGQAIGVASFDSDSSTTVQWGTASSATGLRPFGLCSESAEIAQFLANPLAVQTHTISYTKDTPDLCGGNDAPGNWGMIDFNGGANSNNDTKDWVQNGYDGEVYSGTPGQTCPAEAFACYEGDPGAASNSLDSRVDTLESNGTVVTLPIYDFDDGNGGNAEFHIVGFARVVIVDHKFNGAESQRYITLRFEPGVITGGCCSPGGTVTNARAMAICDVDRGNLGSC